MPGSVSLRTRSGGAWKGPPAQRRIPCRPARPATAPTSRAPSLLRWSSTSGVPIARPCGRSRSGARSRDRKRTLAIAASVSVVGPISRRRDFCGDAVTYPLPIRIVTRPTALFLNNSLGICGGPPGDRTRDTLIKSNPRACFRPFLAVSGPHLTPH